MEETSVAGQAPESAVDVREPAVEHVPEPTTANAGSAPISGDVDGSGAAADEDASSVPAVTADPRSVRALRSVRANIAAILVAVAVVVICRYNQHAGHDYGDDFSLYIRQAKAITDGHIRAVIDENRFTLTHSSWHTFSPSIYPWGFPLMLAPIYLITGIDYSIFKLFEAILFGAFLLLLYGIANKRIGRIGALVVMTTIGLSVAYVSWTDTVLSEFPYLFVGFLALWLLDRARTVRNGVGGFEGDRLWPLIVVGAAAAYAYSTRREGSAFIAAVLAAQVAWIIGRWWRRDRSVPLRLRWTRLATPIASFLVFIGVMRVLLPAPFVEHYDHTGLGQVRLNLQAYGFALAEQIGLKDPGRAFPGQSLWGFAGSPGLAKAMFAIFLGLAAIGIVVRLITHFADDIALFTYVAVCTLAIGIAPFRDSRYIFSITPLLVYFAFQGIAGLPEMFRHLLPDAAHTRRFVAMPMASIAIALLAVGNGTDTWHKTEFLYDTGTYTLDGVAQPSWQDMFAEVRSATKPTDVIAFFRARTMVLYTDRNAIQSTDIQIVIANADYYAQRKDPTNYSQAPLDSLDAAQLGFTLVWENSEFELWQVPKK